MPAMTLSRVLFPAPLAPMRPTRSPEVTETSIPDRARMTRTVGRAPRSPWSNAPLSVFEAFVLTRNDRSTSRSRIDAIRSEGEDDPSLKVEYDTHADRAQHRDQQQAGQVGG